MKITKKLNSILNHFDYLTVCKINLKNCYMNFIYVHDTEKNIIINLLRNVSRNETCTFAVINPGGCPGKIIVMNLNSLT